MVKPSQGPTNLPSHRKMPISLWPSIPLLLHQSLLLPSDDGQLQLLHILPDGMPGAHWTKMCPLVPTVPSCQRNKMQPILNLNAIAIPFKAMPRQCPLLHKANQRLLQNGSKAYRRSRMTEMQAKQTTMLIRTVLCLKERHPCCPKPSKLKPRWQLAQASPLVNLLWSFQQNLCNPCLVQLRLQLLHQCPSQSSRGLDRINRQVD